ncbi:unnamed protein product [Ectocarpus sp. 13 AM-2016]
MLLYPLCCFNVPLRRTTLLAFAGLPSSSMLVGHARASQQISRQQCSNGAFVPRGLWFILSALL